VVTMSKSPTTEMPMESACKRCRFVPVGARTRDVAGVSDNVVTTGGTGTPVTINSETVTSVRLEVVSVSVVVIL